jgi:site-specific DNA recombinase
VRAGNEEAVIPGPRIKPGTRLYRSWKDKTHCVLVLPDGFEWNGSWHGSLSAIAKAITGTNWNGYTFFQAPAIEEQERRSAPERCARTRAGAEPNQRVAGRAGRTPMRDRARPKTLRCAIYTRKSSEEGLEQDFNSLHAQREACEAYISSQRHEGWTALAAHYDDGGYSGGSMERPALRRLLADIAARQVDVLVVYKVDRLTRSLTDFAKIVEVFDAQQVSFVSVTQQFNTTSSMGRLTLNVLLSFAQFEREVTGERIRDKIAASKKKGLWMGGWVPIGYDRKDRTLIINKSEAEIVRTIFSLYLKLKNVRLVEAELDRRKIRTKPYVATTGRVIGNRPFSRGHIYKILSCALYTGQIVHKGASHPGQHPSIIDQATWDAVQAQLGRNGAEHKTRANVREPSLLAGLLVDQTGNKFTTAHARKNGKQYRYYVAAGPEPKPKTQAGHSPVRIAASEIEPLVLNALMGFLREPSFAGGAQRVFRSIWASAIY